MGKFLSLVILSVYKITSISSVDKKIDKLQKKLVNENHLIYSSRKT